MAKFISFFILKLALIIILCLVARVPEASAVINVQDFGAKADGKTDSSAAFLAAWQSACNTSTAPRGVVPGVYVPDGEFLLGSVVFKGPCKSHMDFRIKGTLVSSPDYSDLDSSGRWIKFDRVDGLQINGGTIDGRGQALWTCKQKKGDCPRGLTSLTVSRSQNVLIIYLSSIHSKLYHIVINGSQNVRLSHTNITAPGNSPNTDGIHVQDSTDVVITHSRIMTGDDCVSVGPGTYNLLIRDMFCGPGHGISIGSLGKGEGKQEAGVEKVEVSSVTFSGTQNGARIKSWASTTTGYVKNVVFENITMENVNNPIVIDQNYCPHKIGCPKETSHVKVSDVKYSNIRGSSTKKVAVKFDCSASNPCSGIKLEDIDLTYRNKRAQALCKYVHGSNVGVISPPSCL